MNISVKTHVRILVAILCATLLGAPALVYAQQHSSNTIAQGFQGNTQKGAIVGGAIVSTVAGKANSVELASTESTARLAGVVDTTPLVAISTTSKEVQVVLNGTATVLVSDINGRIQAGDKITASPIAGIGMVADADNQVVGTARSDFDGRSGDTRTLTDTDGKKHTIHIGYIPLQVGVAYYQAPGSNFLPPIVQNVANSIAGRQVSLIRILLCTFLLLLGFVGITVLIYTSVRSAITSVGRNPLAAAAIRKSLYQVIVVAVIVLAGTLLASYLILSV